MTRGDNPRISLLRTWSKAHCSDLHTFWCALDQIFSIFHVAEFPFGFLWNWRTRTVKGIKAEICSCQNGELKAGTDLVVVASALHPLKKKKKKKWPQIQIPKYGFKCCLGISVLKMLTCAASLSRNCRQYLKQLRSRWRCIYPYAFLCQEKCKTCDQQYCYNQKTTSSPWK